MLTKYCPQKIKFASLPTYLSQNQLTFISIRQDQHAPSEFWISDLSTFIMRCLLQEDNNINSFKMALSSYIMSRKVEPALKTESLYFSYASIEWMDWIQNEYHEGTGEMRHEIRPQQLHIHASFIPPAQTEPSLQTLNSSDHQCCHGNSWPITW